MPIRVRHKVSDKITSGRAGVSRTFFSHMWGLRHVLKVNDVAKAPSPDATVTFTASVVDGSNLTEYTFSSVSLGTADSTRKIVVAASALQGAGTISTLTVAGITATIVKVQSQDTGRMELWQADVPTGTTGDIVVTWNAGTLQCAIGVHSVLNAASGAHETDGDNSDPWNDSITVPAGGVLIGAAVHGSTLSTFSWTNLTERYDETLENQVSHSGASDAFAELQTQRSITMTPSDPDQGIMVLASWAKA